MGDHLLCDPVPRLHPDHETGDLRRPPVREMGGGEDGVGNVDLGDLHGDPVLFADQVGFPGVTFSTGLR